VLKYIHVGYIHFTVRVSAYQKVSLEMHYEIFNYESFRNYVKFSKFQSRFFNFKFSVKLTTYLKSELSDLLIYLT